MKKDTALVILFLAAVSLSLQPALLHAPSRELVGGSQVGGYYAWLYWVWTQAWEKGQSLSHTAMIMHPAGVPLFPQSPLSELLAFALVPAAGPFAAVNILLALYPVLSGSTAYLFFRKLTKDPPAAFAGAAAFAFSHYMLTQRLHGQVIEAALMFAPLFAWTLLDFLERPSPRRGALAGAAFLGLGLSGPYVLWTFGVMLLLAAGSYDLLFGPRVLLKRSRWPLFAWLGAACAVIALVYSPLLALSGRLAGGEEFTSLSLAAFFDPPFWHRSALVQSLRPLAARSAYPEQIMAYVGACAALLIGLAVRLKPRDPALRFWLWIFAWSAVMGLGTTLILAPGIDTGVPLPYSAFRALPVLSAFRNTGRMMTLGSFALAALLALSLSRLTARLAVRRRAAIAAAVVALGFIELDLPAAARWLTPTELPAIYGRIQSDPDPFALLELPSSIDARGTPLFQSQLYMMRQIRHGRPIVLGAPTRYLPEALELTESTDVFYELTHPWVLERLAIDPRLAERRRTLARKGRAILREKGVKYVLFHSALAPYGPEIQTRLKAFLDDVVGPPIEADAAGRFLYSAERAAK